MAEEKVLIVDDDPNVGRLAKRQLNGAYTVYDATSATRALEILKAEGPFAVIVSDMQMPEISGLQLLRSVHEEFPDVVRIMLTGNVDQRTAVHALNDAHIHHFLNKPCSPSDMAKAIESAVSRYRVTTAERILLQETLVGSVSVLTELIAVIDPTQQERGAELKRLSKDLYKEVRGKGSWELEIAAMLTRVGHALLPAELLLKLRRGIKPSGVELQLIAQTPGTAHRLIAKIPRLQRVAEIVRLSNRGYDGTGWPQDGPAGEELPFESRVLLLVQDLIELQQGGISISDTLETMSRHPLRYDPALLRAARKLWITQAKAPAQEGPYTIRADELCVGQRVMRDIKTSDGVLLLLAGNEITEVSVARIQNYARLVGLEGEILVDAKIPVRTTEKTA